MTDLMMCNMCGKPAGSTFYLATAQGITLCSCSFCVRFFKPPYRVSLHGEGDEDDTLERRREFDDRMRIFGLRGDDHPGATWPEPAS